MVPMATIRICPHFALCNSRSLAGKIIASIPISKKGNFLGDRVPSRSNIIIMVIATIHHLVGSPYGPSSHFKMVLTIPPPG